MTTQSSQIRTKEIASKKGKVGHLTLNAPKALNSLSLEMIQSAFQQLSRWAEDDAIACILMDGAGDKGFCAGGDVQKLYQSAIDNPGGPCDYAEQFFVEEYQLDYLIHSYPKPIICIGSGIVMGGGLGLMQGASHRVVSESSRIAMPEVTIGLFPDVGATRFLNDLPQGLGLFFALTGASINASDAISLGLADHYVESSNIGNIVQQLEKVSWTKDIKKNKERVTSLLADFAVSEDKRNNDVPSELANCRDEIEDACRSGALGDVIHALDSIDTDSGWLKKSIKTLHHGSPLSALLIFEQLRRHRYVTQKAAFEADLVLATNCVRYPEFAEGVRALLIDKDRKPKWAFKHFSHVPASVMESFFTPPWEQNPLSTRL
jgi:enoyl-CoA hydratase/carnithine racemase